MMIVKPQCSQKHVLVLGHGRPSTWNGCSRFCVPLPISKPFTVMPLRTSSWICFRGLSDSVLKFLTPPDRPGPNQKLTVPMLEDLETRIDLSRQTALLTRLLKSRWIAPPGVELGCAKLRKLHLQLNMPHFGDLEPIIPRALQGWQSSRKIRGLTIVAIVTSKQCTVVLRATLCGERRLNT